MKNNNVHPRWIMGLHDLPESETDIRLKITWADGDQSLVTLSGRMRQAVEAMLVGPIFCASPVRLSDAVFRIKEALGRAIHERETTSEGRYFYRLSATVEIVDQKEAA